jgi:hypothetical protein
MTTLTLVNKKQLYISMEVTSAIIEKVEKWDETSFSTTSQVSGGGGYIYQG